jgi:hypothetical protein
MKFLLLAVLVMAPAFASVDRVDARWARKEARELRKWAKSEVREARREAAQDRRELRREEQRIRQQLRSELRLNRKF